MDFTDSGYYLKQHFDALKRDDLGTPIYDKELQEIIDNLFKSPALNSMGYKLYYDFFNALLSKAANNHHVYYTIAEGNNSQKPFVGSVLTGDIWKYWRPNDNIFIAAGTGKGKNTFIKNELLRHLGNKKAVIFENRESLMLQQIVDMVLEIDPEALKYQNIDDGMIVFSNKQVMLVSYQTASIKLALQDSRFIQFCLEADYFVFDEIHFILDDSLFNKGISFFSNYFFPNIEQEAENEEQLKQTLAIINKNITDIQNTARFNMNNTIQALTEQKQQEMISNLLYGDQQYHSLRFEETNCMNAIQGILQKKANSVFKATRIFMSASMEEFYTFLQSEQPFNEKPTDISTLPDIAEAQDYPRIHDTLCEMRHGTNRYHILSMQTDYSYITPYQFKKIEDICAEIEKSPKQEKWLIFVTSIAKGEKLKDYIKEHIDDEVYFINAENQLNRDNKEIYKSIVANCSFPCRILIATTVIYNGINIKDPHVKHIVLPFSTPPVIKQLIGRKRIDKDKDGNPEKLNVYFPEVTYDEINERLRGAIGDHFGIMELKNSLFRQALMYSNHMLRNTNRIELTPKS